MTLNGHFALCFEIYASFGAHYKHLNEDRPILSAAKMSCPPHVDWASTPMTWIYHLLTCLLGCHSYSTQVYTLYTENVSRRVFQKITGSRLNRDIVSYVMHMICWRHNSATEMSFSWLIQNASSLLWLEVHSGWTGVRSRLHHYM